MSDRLMSIVSILLHSSLDIITLLPKFLLAGRKTKMGTQDSGGPLTINFHLS